MTWASWQAVCHSYEGNWSPMLCFFTLRGIYPGIYSRFCDLQQEFSPAKLISHVGGWSSESLLPCNGWQRLSRQRRVHSGVSSPRDVCPPPHATVYAGAIQASFRKVSDLENKGTRLEDFFPLPNSENLVAVLQVSSGHYNIIWTYCLIS